MLTYMLTNNLWLFHAHKVNNNVPFKTILNITRVPCNFVATLKKIANRKNMHPDMFPHNLVIPVTNKCSNKCMFYIKMSALFAKNRC